jgi:hypothetical protein
MQLDDNTVHDGQSRTAAGTTQSYSVACTGR